MAVSAYSNADHADRTIAQINITPLVDVLLVLLVIFMIAAPVLTAPLPLRLPQAGPPAPPSARVTLRVSSAGQFELQGQRFSAAALPVALRSLGSRAPSTVLEVEASVDADYQSFATALAAAQSSGLSNIALRQQ